MASIGAFVSGDRDILDNLRYKLRSQIYAKSLPMPIVIGNLKRLELIKNNPRLQVNSIDQYVEIMNNLKLANPKMMDVAVPANVKGLTLNQI